MTYICKGYIRGSASPLAKLTTSQVIEIYLSKEKHLYLAALYHVSSTTICRIKRGERWQHLTKQLENIT